jgi:chromosomal replication initiator protein
MNGKKQGVLEPADQIWAKALLTLREKVNPDLFNLWFTSVRAVEANGESFTLEVVNDFSELWLRNNYLGLIEDVLACQTGRRWRIQFSVAVGGHAAAAPSPAEIAPEPAPQRQRPVRAAVEEPALAENIFNPNNTFDTFVVGNNNNFAHAAAMSVAQTPGKSYNPLFLYGGVGLGKTHLLHAIGQHVAGHKKGVKVVYITFEKFTNEYIEAIQNNQFARFRKKYRQTGVLLIDDIQFLAGKERIQEEFFHTFNALHEAHHQLVLTCDRPPSELQGVEQRLVSRFEWGLVTDLQPPDVEMRLAILQKKAASMSLAVSPDLLQFLAERIRSNVRRLEGALIRVASYASLTGRKPTVETVENLLREILHEEGRQTVTIEFIQKRVAEHFDLRLADMSSKRRPENIAFPRQIAMYLARQLTESSLSVIGEAFGGRDHGTVLHACRLVKDRMEVDANVRQVVNYLEKQLLR